MQDNSLNDSSLTDSTTAINSIPSTPENAMASSKIDLLSKPLYSKKQFSEAYFQRFSGIARLYGLDALADLYHAHFCVIGIGGVGSWAAEALARTGLGEITLIDMDEVCVTNTNRQIHALVGNVGKSKVEMMTDRILAINPECKVHIIDDFISPENVKKYLTNEIDYVIDAIDSIKAKIALLYHCRRNKIAVITTGGAGGQIDPTLIQVDDLARTSQDPLAAKVREQLRYHYKVEKNSKGKIGIDCVFSTEQLRYPQTDGTVCFSKSADTGSMRMDCSAGFGAVTMVTANFGFIAASHAIKKYLNKCTVKRKS